MLLQFAKILWIKKEEFESISNGNKYHDSYANVFKKGFLSLSGQSYVETLRHLEYYIKCSGSYSTDNITKLQQVALDYMFLTDIRNMTHHANAKSTAKTRNLKYYKENGYSDMDEMSMENLKNFIGKAIKW